LGETVTLTATVRVPALVTALPTGSVQFQVDGANYGSPVALSNRKASLSVSMNTAGFHTAAASYSGDTNFGPNVSGSVNVCVASCTSIDTSANSFILSNEAPGYLIHKLVAAGYGTSSVYTALTALKDLPGAETILTLPFMDALHTAPAGAEIFNPLSDYDYYGAIAISDNGTVSFVDLTGPSYSGQPNTTTLTTGNLPLDKAKFVYGNASSGAIPAVLTSWQILKPFMPNPPLYFSTTYFAFAVAWSDGYKTYLPRQVKN